MPRKWFITHGSRLGVFVATLLCLLITTNYQPSTIYAQACQDTSINKRADWLVTALNVAGNFRSTRNECIRDIGAQFSETQVEDYSAFKTKFYTNPGGTQTITGPSPSITNLTRYLSTGDLVLNGVTCPSPGAAVIFVDGNLVIDNNINCGSTTNNTQGLLFIVGGNVIISQSVQNIDGFIIAAGANSIVCTASTNTSNRTSCPAASSVSTNRLVVNGSLLSLAKSVTTSIYFNRILPGVANNTLAAELFNFQPKYYALFRDLMSEPRNQWREVAGVVTLPAYSQSSYGGYTQSSYSSPLAVTCSASPNPGQRDQNITFTATPTGGSGVYPNYLWQVSGEGSQTTNPAIYNFDQNGTYTANIQITDSVGNEATGNCSVSINTSYTQSNYYSQSNYYTQSNYYSQSSYASTLSLSNNAPGGRGLSVVRGTPGSNATVTATTTGSSALVSFTLDNSVPTGMTVNINPSSCTSNCSTTVTISATSQVPTGSRTIIIRGSAPGFTSTTTSFAVNVE
jgi:hypothetical protein